MIDRFGGMLEALRHAEAILSYAPEISTNKNGAGPSTSTHRALALVRAAIAKAEGRALHTEGE